MTPRIMCECVATPERNKILNEKVAGSTAAWGALTIGTAWAKDYKHLIIIRLLVGLFEAGLFPCLTM